MNILDMLHGGPKLTQNEVRRRMNAGMTMDEAIADLADEVVKTTAEEGRRGMVHGVVQEIELNG